LEAWKLGGLEAWKLEGLEAWRLGSLEAWRLGKLGALRRSLEKLGALEASKAWRPGAGRDFGPLGA